MDHRQTQTRSYAESQASRARPRQRQSSIAARPDRIALWAVIMAVVAMGAAAASSEGATRPLPTPAAKHAAASPGVSHPATLQSVRSLIQAAAGNLPESA